MRIPIFIETICQKVIDKYDEQNGLKSRGDAFAELVSNGMELTNLKYDIVSANHDPEEFEPGALRDVIESDEFMPNFDIKALKAFK